MADLIFRVGEQDSSRVKKLNQLASDGGGGVYVLVDAGGGAVELQPLTVGATPPSSPSVGTLWVDTN
jgi:hypothetical protein